MKRGGKYRCCDCGVEFEWHNGTAEPQPNPCCGSLYRKWLDYERWRLK